LHQTRGEYILGWVIVYRIKVSIKGSSDAGAKHNSSWYLR
jgi:hypothetical protein